MNNNTTYILFGALVLLLGTLALVLYNGPTPSATGDALFPSMLAKGEEVAAKDIVKVVIQSKQPADDELVFDRVDDNTWKISAPRPMAADSSRISSLIDSIRSARKADKDAPKSLKAAGLDSPSRVILLTDKDGKEYTLTIGEVELGTERALAFVTTSERDKKPLAVRKQAIESALEGLNYFRAKDLLGSDRDAREVKVTLGKKTVELKKEKDRWVMVQPPYGPIDAAEIVGKLSGLSVDHRNDKESDFVKDGADKLAEYNLDPAKGDVLTIGVTRGEGKSAKTTLLTVGVSKKADANAKKGDDGKKYFAGVGDGAKRDIVKVSVESVKPFQELVEQPDKYRPKSLVQMDSFQSPDGLDITNSYGTIELRKKEGGGGMPPPRGAPPDGGWELYRGDAANAVDEQQARLLIDELKKRDLVTGYVDAARKKELGLEKPDVTVKVYVDAFTKSADPKKSTKPVLKKDAKALAELRFGRVEQGQVAVERVWGNDTSIVLVPQGVLDLVRKGPLAYLDRAIPPFNAVPPDQDVTKIEVTRADGTYEIERATRKEPWLFTRPPALKGKKASDQVVGELLNDLNQMRAEELVSEKADAKQLDEFGLAKPAIKIVVTITKDKKAETKTFDLGKETPRGVHLKRSDRDMVYLVSPGLLGAINRELRDTTIFNFNPDQVTSLTIKGWTKVIGATFTLSLERKDRKWLVKSQADFVVDESKVDNLINEMSRLRAEKFAAAGKGLSLPEGALVIEVGLPDKKSVTLTVGDIDGTGVSASSDQLKGEFFVIPRGSFEDMKKAPAFFRK